MTSMFFTTAPDPTELLGYMAGALRDCLGGCTDDAIEWEGQLLWDEFGGEAGFAAERSDDASMQLATRIANQLRRIAAAAAGQDIAELALINAEAFDEGRQMVAVAGQLLAA